MAGKNESYEVRLNVDIVAAQVLSAAGNSAEAARKLHATIKSAQKAGLFASKLDATLALAEIELKMGKKKDARALLESIEKEGRSKGFLLIARKAALLAASATSTRF